MVPGYIQKYWEGRNMYKFLIFIVVLFMNAGMVSAQVYTWTDKDGQVHYGSQPPVQAKTKEVKINKYTTDRETVDRLDKNRSKARSTSSSTNKRRKSSQSRDAKSGDESNKKICKKYTDRYNRYKRDGVPGINLLTGRKQKLTGKAKQDAIADTKETMDIFCE